MKTLLLLSASVSLAFAGVDGVVINGTTGKPQPSVMVSLVQPSAQGMQTLATVRSDAQGKFKIDKEAPAGAPVMMQAIFDKASYTEMLPPGTPTTGVQLQVYDSGKDPESGKIAQHMIVLEPAASGVQVSARLSCSTIRPSSPTPIRRRARLQFYLPKSAGDKPQVTVTSATGDAGAAVGFANQNAGSVQDRLSDQAGTDADRRGLRSARLRHLHGKKFGSRGADAPGDAGYGHARRRGLDLLGQEPQTQAHIYNVPDREFRSEDRRHRLAARLRRPTAEEDAGQPQIEVEPARIYSRMYWVLGLTFGILLLGGAMLYRRGAA